MKTNCFLWLCNHPDGAPHDMTQDYLDSINATAIATAWGARLEGQTLNHTTEPGLLHAYEAIRDAVAYIGHGNDCDGERIPGTPELTAHSSRDDLDYRWE